MARDLDLLSGRITPQLLRLCLPLLAANGLQQLYNIINSLVVTHYIGDGAFAALGVAESVMNLFIFAITGACMGASVLVARFYGEGNHTKLRRQIYVSFVLIGGSTITAVALGQLFLPRLLRLIRTPAALMDDVSAYLRIILLGMVFTFSYNLLASILRAVGDTKAALYFLLISLGYNLVAAWLFVAVLQMGIAGTALATASAQVVSSFLCLLYIRRRRRFLRVEREDMHLDRTLIHLTSSYAAVAALQQSSLYLGKLMVQSAVNPLGPAAISAFTATNRVENLVQTVGISGCESVAIFTAQNKGAGQETRALRGFIRGGFMIVLSGLVFSLLMHFGARPMLLPFLPDNPEGITQAVSYLRIVSVFYALSFCGHSYVGWYRGNGRMQITFWGTTIQIFVRVAGTFLLVAALGLNAVALATGLGWVVIVLFHSAVFVLERRGIWPKKRSAD